MISTADRVDGTAAGDPLADPLTAVLITAQQHQAAAQSAEAALLVTAVEWAVLHPAPTPAAAAKYTIGRDETDLHLAGDGAPLIDDWCIAELAGALRLTAEAGQRLIGEAIELKYRLPRLWAMVHTGKVAVWQARRVAARTLRLSLVAAGFVDRQIVVRAGRIGPVVLDRLIAEAVARHMPDTAARLHAQQTERRCFTFDHRPGDDGLAGQSCVYGILDLPDALDLDAAITDGARRLKQLGDTTSLDVRRARAAGDLARRQPCLDSADPAEPTAGQVMPRQVVLYLHLSDLALTAGPDAAPIGRVQNTQQPVLTAQIRDWLGRPDSHITVKPVIDLHESVAVDAYEIPDRIRERVTLRQPTCVFPWCHKNSTHTDLDHRIRYDTDGPPGQTSTDNLAPLCRRHHRLKTFTRWRYQPHAEPGCHLWTSPHGLRFLRDHTGTTAISHDRPPQGHRAVERMS